MNTTLENQPTEAVAPPTQADREAVERLTGGRVKIEAELAKIIVGQKDVIEQLLIALFAGGHCLITGAPGLAKTLLVKTIARIFHLKFQRVQFTPDLMPTDITGTEILQDTPEGRKMTFVHGPVFANIILADEINRTPPKTQAALLEAMQEHQVTAAGIRHALQEPFFVLATQNPIEMEGTYPLPEAQLDRFLFKLLVTSPTFEDLAVIVDRTTGTPQAPIDAVITGEAILNMRSLAREVPLAPNVREFAIKVVLGTHPDSPHAPGAIKQFVRYGSSPRGAQAIVTTAKIKALLAGRYNVAIEDIVAVAAPALRHRIILNFEGQAEGIVSDMLIEQILEKTKADTEVRV